MANAAGRAFYRYKFTRRDGVIMTFTLAAAALIVMGGAMGAYSYNYFLPVNDVSGREYCFQNSFNFLLRGSGSTGYKGGEIIMGLKINNLWFRYPQAGEPCLKNINISIDKGEIVLITGKSGSGKTTLLRNLKPSVTPNGLISGSIECDFTDDIDSSTGFVFQRPEDQAVREYVWQELAFALESKGMDSETIRKRTAETASFFGIEGLFGRKISELSGGQQQTVALASVMADMPDILILDEPCSMLDPVSAVNFAENLKRINAEFGTTIILSAHDLGDFIPLCDKLCVMDGGEVKYYGKPAETVAQMRDDKSPALRDMPCQCYVSAALGKRDPSLTVSSGRRFLESYALEKQAVSGYKKGASAGG